MRKGVKRIAATALVAMGLCQPSMASDLPTVMNWTAYEVGSSAHSQAVAIGNMLKEKEGVTVRILPGRNDVSRMSPLANGRADLCSCGASIYLAQEGLDPFQGKNWGPKPVRSVMMAFSPVGMIMATQEDRGIGSLAEMKGKRVSYIKGGSQNVITDAYLAAAGLTWDDVTRVDFDSYVSSVDGLINGQVDAAIAFSVSPVMQKVASAPGGLRWLPLDHTAEDKWSRFFEVIPYMVKTKTRLGAGIEKGSSIDAAMYPYPILATLDGQVSNETVEALVASMDRNFESFKDDAPGASGWAIDMQQTSWVVPFHDGAVAYLKSVGKWSDADQANNDALIERQGVLAKAWSDYTAEKGDLDGEDFTAGWLEARSAALTAAGMPMNVSQ